MNQTVAQLGDLKNKWQPFINESAPGLSAAKTLFVAQVAENHEFLNESITTNIMSNGQNSNGIGSITLPTNVKAGFVNFGNQTPGSGDAPTTLLSMAMSVAANTIGFDLLPTVPIYQPSVMLQYIDYVYGGGRLDTAGNEPQIVTLNVDSLRGSAAFAVGATVLVYAATGATDPCVTLQFLGFTRLEAYPVFKIVSVTDGKDLGMMLCDAKGTVPCEHVSVTCSELGDQCSGNSLALTVIQLPELTPEERIPME